MKRILAGLALLTVAACGSSSDGNTPYTTLEQVSRSLAARDTAEPDQFTATRASLTAAGIRRPVLVVRVPASNTSVGLIQHDDDRGLTIWRSIGDATVTTDGGVLRNTRGFGPDLHSLETGQVRRALAGGGANSYSRTYRAIDGEGVLRRARLHCEMAPMGPVRVEILGIAYDTVHFRETCHAPGGAVAFRNDYWRGGDGTIWKSRQWIGTVLGHATFERVSNDRP